MLSVAANGTNRPYRLGCASIPRKQMMVRSDRWPRWSDVIDDPHRVVSSSTSDSPRIRRPLWAVDVPLTGYWSDGADLTRLEPWCNGLHGRSVARCSRATGRRDQRSLGETDGADAHRAVCPEEIDADLGTCHRWRDRAPPPACPDPSDICSRDFTTISCEILLPRLSSRSVRRDRAIMPWTQRTTSGQSRPHHGGRFLKAKLLNQRAVAVEGVGPQRRDAWTRPAPTPRGSRRGEHFDRDQHAAGGQAYKLFFGHTAARANRLAEHAAPTWPTSCAAAKRSFVCHCC